MTGAPAAVAVEATGAPQTAGAPSPAPHVHRPPAALDDLRAQQTPTPDDDIPDVSLTLGGPSHTVDVEGYFTDSVIRYEVRASPDNMVHTARSGTVITIEPIGVGSATVTVTGVRFGSDERKQFTVTVSAMVAAPVAVGSIEAATVTEGATHMVTASDHFEGEGVMYTAESSDPGVATVAVDGAVVTVTGIAAGSATVTVTATNAGGSAEQSFAVTVVPSAPAAVGAIPAATLTEGATHAVTAPDYFSGEAVTYTAESSNAEVATVAVGGATVVVTAVAVGSATITVTATSGGGSAEQSFAVTVVPSAPTAVGAIPAATLTEGATHMVTAADHFEGAGAMYTAESSDPSVATVVVDGAAVTVTGVAAGSATVTVTATNAGGSAEQSFAVTVVPSAPAAVGSIPAATLTEGATHMVTASDYFEGEGVMYTAESSDPGVATVGVEGAVVTVTAVAAGSATVTVTAANAGGRAEQPFAVTVVPPAPAAVGSIEAATLTEGGTHAVTASDYFEGAGLAYAAESSDAAVATVAVDGAAVTVAGVAAGSATVTVTATNAGGSAGQSFAVTVVPPAPSAPPATGSIEAATLTEGSTHAVTASDYFEGAGLAYAAESSDAAVATVAVDGAVVTVTAVAVGSATVTVTATNAGGSAEQSFAVTVAPPAPTATGSIKAATLTEGATHMVTASDYFGGEGVTYDAESSDPGVATVAVDGAAVDGAAVTVTAVAVGSAMVTVTATNAGGSAQQSFSVTVRLPPVTLTLGGAAQTIELAEHFGDAVTSFDVSVSPAGVVQASMSGSLLTLTPLAVGTATVTVEVTAGEVSALHLFPATVVPAAPTALGSIAALTLAERETHTVSASEYFAGEGVTYDAESSDPGVATVAVDGAAVTVTAIAAGEATVTVTATNEGGKAEQSFVVTIQLPAVTLTLGGAARAIELADYFGDEVTGYEVAVSPSGIVHVSRSGSQLTLTAVAAGSATVTVTATSGGGSAEQSFAVAVLPLAPAAVGSIEVATLTEGATHMVTASDYFVGEGVTYTAGSSDPGVATVGVEGAEVTLTAVAAGSATVTVTATNAGGGAEQRFAVTVAPPAPAAVGSIEAATLTEGATHMVTASDYFVGEGVTYTAGSSDPGVATVGVEGAEVTLTAVAVGSATVTVTAAKAGGSAEQAFAVTVLPPAPTAVGAIAAATLTEGATHMVTASDYFEGEGAMYTAESSDPGVATVAVEGAAVTVTAVAAGSATVTVTATNAGGSAEQSFAVTVVSSAPPAPIPVGSIEAATLTEGAAHMVTASDYFEGEGVLYAAESSDTEVASVAVDGAVVTVTAVAAGSAAVTVTATNAGGSAEQAFAVTVLPPAPLAPSAVGSIEVATLTEGATHMVTASDYFEGEGAMYTAESSDTEVASVAVDGAAVTVTAVAVGSATVTVTAANAGGSAEQAFAVTVVSPAPSPVGTIEAVTLAEGGVAQSVDLANYFSGVVVRYSVSGVPAGIVHVWESGGRLTLTPLEAGVATVTVTALGAGGSAEQTFTVTVRARPPRALGAVPLTRLTEGEVLPLDAAAYFEGAGDSRTRRGPRIREWPRSRCMDRVSWSGR